MNGCTSVYPIHDPALCESSGIVCHGNHAPGERHRGGFEGRVTWTDAEQAGTVEPTGDPRVFIIPAEPLPPATWSNR